MGSGRKYQKTNLTRPRKKAGPKRRRQSDQKKRLVALGVDAVLVSRMSSREVLTMLKRPARIAKPS
jgi:hypothetical protein